MVTIFEAKREMPPASLRLVYVTSYRPGRAVEQDPVSKDHKGKINAVLHAYNSSTQG